MYRSRRQTDRLVAQVTVAIANLSSLTERLLHYKEDALSYLGTSGNSLVEQLNFVTDTASEYGDSAHRFIGQAIHANPYLSQVATNPQVVALYDKAAHFAPIAFRTFWPIILLQLGLYLHRRRSAAMVDFSSFGGSSSSQFGDIEVHWGRERLRVALPPPASPLSALKATLFNLTGVPPNHQKLIISGAILKDDLTPLSEYGLVDESASTSSSAPAFWQNWSLTGSKSKKLKKLVLIGDKDVAKVLDRKVPVQEAKPEKVPDSEETIVNKIGEIVGSSLKEWEPKIVELERYAAQQNGAGSGEAKEGEGEPVDKLEAPNPRTAAWLSEVLLQSLLKLDSFDIPSTYAEARKERKAAVKSLQSALDRVDAFISAKL